MKDLADLKMMQDAEHLADAVWKMVISWNSFAKDALGVQIVKAADSVGANIAESFGRFHYGEKLQFLYYARGSVFESKYWLNRTLQRRLIRPVEHQTYADLLTSIARQINGFARDMKARRSTRSAPTQLRESNPVYHVLQRESPEETVIFSDFQLRWLEAGMDADNETLIAIRSNPLHTDS